MLNDSKLTQISEQSGCVHDPLLLIMDSKLSRQKYSVNSIN